MLLRFIAACCLLGLGSLPVAAQTSDTAQGSGAGTVVTPAAALDSELSLVENEMMSAVKAMPDEKFGFAPSAAIFVPGQTDRVRYSENVCPAGDPRRAGQLFLL